MKTVKSKIWLRCWAGLAIAAIVLTASLSPADEKNKKEAILWMDFEKAVAAAKKERKLLVVDFYTDWCGWCKVMDRDTYGNPEVAKYAKTKLIMSKVNAESQARTRFQDNELTYQQLASGFGVRGYPATIFIGPDGEFITLVSGFVPADKFMPILEFLADGHYKIMKYEDFVNKREISPKPPTPAPVQPTATRSGAKPQTPTSEPASKMVGDRLSIAILPFETKGIGDELGEIDMLDKITTIFFNLHRFKVVERAQLERILSEQQLGMTGVIDVSTAAQIGKGIGVDAVVCGSIVRTNSGASIDARLIDTETAAIITAQEAFANGVSLPSLSQMIQDAAQKIKQDLPLVSGYVIKTEPDQLTFDLGYSKGVRKGMKCHIYREGAPIVHPVTNEVIGKSVDELCEAQITDVFDAYSVATIIKAKNGTAKVNDRVVTK